MHKRTFETSGHEVGPVDANVDGNGTTRGPRAVLIDVLSEQGPAGAD